jgi:hypothetical protein
MLAGVSLWQNDPTSYSLLKLKNDQKIKIQQNKIAKIKIAEIK